MSAASVFSVTITLECGSCVIQTHGQEEPLLLGHVRHAVSNLTAVTDKPQDSTAMFGVEFLCMLNKHLARLHSL